jgi:hypothetical protein
MTDREWIMTALDHDRWRTHLMRACTEVIKLERTRARAEKKRADEKRASETIARRERQVQREAVQ